MLLAFIYHCPSLFLSAFLIRFSIFLNFFLADLAALKSPNCSCTYAISNQGLCFENEGLIRGLHADIYAI